MKDPNRFSDLTVKEIRHRINGPNASVIIPLGIIEQHGYHLPTFTDSIIAEGISARVARKLDLLYLPCLFSSYSGGMLPGTINFNPATLLLCLRDLCTSLAQQGFKNLFMVLGHGGSENLKVLENSLPLMLRENPLFDGVLVAFMPYWRYSPAFLEGCRQQDWHAGRVETSMILHLRPDLVDEDRTVDEPGVMRELRSHPDYYQKHEKPFDGPEVLARITQRPDVRVGVMGDLAGSSAEAGEAMIQEAVTGLAARIDQMLRERTAEYREVETPLTPIAL